MTGVVLCADRADGRLIIARTERRWARFMARNGQRFIGKLFRFSKTKHEDAGFGKFFFPDSGGADSAQEGMESLAGRVHDCVLPGRIPPSLFRFP
jgi:hypothetical protein